MKRVLFSILMAGLILGPNMHVQGGMLSEIKSSTFPNSHKKDFQAALKNAKTDVQKQYVEGRIKKILEEGKSLRYGKKSLDKDLLSLFVKKGALMNGVMRRLDDDRQRNKMPIANLDKNVDTILDAILVLNQIPVSNSDVDYDYFENRVEYEVFHISKLIGKGNDIPSAQKLKWAVDQIEELSNKEKDSLKCLYEALTVFTRKNFDKEVLRKYVRFTKSVLASTKQQQNLSVLELICTISLFDDEKLLKMSESELLTLIKEITAEFNEYRNQGRVKDRGLAQGILQHVIEEKLLGRKTPMVFSDDY